MRIELTFWVTGAHCWSDQLQGKGIEQSRKCGKQGGSQVIRRALKEFYKGIPATPAGNSR